MKIHHSFGRKSSSFVPLAVAVALVSGNLHAGGITEHLAGAFHAIEHVENPKLAALLSQEQRGYYGMGALYPDTFGYPPMGTWDWGIYNALDAGHLMTLPNAYGSRLHQMLTQYSNPSAALDDPGFRALLAHYMGVLAHIALDKHFDHYFLQRVDNQCGFYDGGGSGFIGTINDAESQGFTDYWLDSAMANYSSTAKVGWDITIRPTWPAVPDNVYPVMDQAYPATAPFGSGVNLSAEGNHLSVVNQYLGVFGFWPPAWCIDWCEERCPWAVDNLLSNFGGVLDSSKVVAGYINETWSILESGGIPNFEESPLWSNFKSPNSPIITDLSVPESMRWHYDFASWITFPNWTGVSHFQFAHIKVGGGPKQLATLTLRDVGSLDGFLFLTRSEFYDLNVPEILLAQDVVAFQVSETRIAALMGSGPAKNGYELKVMDLSAGLPSPWVVVDQHVTAFELEGERIGYLKRLGSGASKSSKFLVLDGWLYSDPITLAKGKIGGFHLDGDRIAVLMKGKPQDRILARDGISKSDAWSIAFQHQKIEDFQLDGGRIGVLLAGNGEFLVKSAPADIDLKADWIQWVSQGFDHERILLREGWLGAIRDGIVVAKQDPEDEFTNVGPGSSLVHFGPAPDPGENPTWMAADENGLLYEGVVDGTLAYSVGLPDEGVVRQVDIATEPVPVPNWNPRATKRYGVLIDDRLYVKSRCWIVDSAP